LESPSEYVFYEYPEQRELVLDPDRSILTWFTTVTFTVNVVWGKTVSAEFEGLTAVFMKSSISWDTAVSSVETQPTFRAALLATCFMLVSCLASFTTLKMDMNL
jgi:hypothetical protein